MPLQAGIVGLPNTGKSALFNAITCSEAEAANYPFSTVDPNIGVVEVPDPRLWKLSELVKPKKTIPTAFHFVDIAGLAKGGGYGRQFLANIREVDAIVHVVRLFEDENVEHTSKELNPLADIETINLELVLADYEVIERRVEKTVKQARGDKNAAPELEFQKYLLEELEQGKFASKIARDEQEHRWIKEYQLLTAKPMLYVCNVGEGDLAGAEDNPKVKAVREFATGEGTEMIVVSAKVESELSRLDEEERTMFMEELGLRESGLDRLVHAAYHILGLSTFFTAGEKEVRAWTFRRGWKAPQCAGVIHTDFEKLFIRVEVISFDDYVTLGSENAAKDAGKMHLEGKDYVLQDGDVCFFRIGGK